MEIYDVVTKITGPIEPVGDSRVDEQRFKNLELTIELVERLIQDIDSVSRSKDHHAASMSKAGKTADEYLLELRQYTD